MQVRSKIAILTSLSLLGSCGNPPPKEPEAIRPVRAIQIADETSILRHWFPGQAKAKEEVDIAFEVGGRLIERPVKVGDSVQEDQLLARLDPRDFQNELEAAQARLERAKAYQERIAKAASSGAVSKQELTDANAQYDMAKAELSIKQKALSDSRILAPFAGTIAMTYVENFWNVRMKQPVMRLLDTSEIKLTVNIPEDRISMVPYVKTVACRFDAYPDKEVLGKVYEVGTEASKTTRTYPVTILMKQPEGFRILPGMTGEASPRDTDIPEELDQRGYYLPPGALLSRSGQKSAVWVIDGKTKTVSLLEVENLGLGAYGILVKGLTKGQWVATAGVHYLRAGQKVRILDAENASTGAGR
jgi:RND family efflux transporter MFP subunit